jgi:hypothetical protein
LPVATISEEKKSKRFPVPIAGVREATMFGKRQGIRAAGLLADEITMAEASGEPTSSPGFSSLKVFVYDACARHGELPALQKIFDEAAVPWSTRMKLFMAYKTALAVSDGNVHAFLDVDLSPPPDARKVAVLAYWRQAPPDVLAHFIKDKGFFPPTLADVRQCFVSLFKECKDIWPKGDVTRDKVHRTTIRRMGLPLGKDKIGRPRGK